jgi:hypothetical protein
MEHVEWAEVVSHRCRCALDGRWITVTVERWGKAGKKVPHRVTSLWDDAPPGAEPYVHADDLSEGKAMKRLDSMIETFSGRRFEGRWIVCESTRVPKGWVNEPWPGPCERTSYGSGLVTTKAAQDRMDYSIFQLTGAYPPR